MTDSDKLVDVFLGLRTRLVRLVIGIVPPKDVEDIVQETYVRVCRIENKDAIREPRSFLFRTAQNLAINHVKRAESRLTDGVDAIDEVSGINDLSYDDQTYAQVTSDEQFALFCEAVRHLPQQCRRAYVLKKVYGYTLKEIAQEMELAESTVEKHIVAGAKKCMLYRREALGGGHQERVTRGARSGRGRSGGQND